MRMLGLTDRRSPSSLEMEHFPWDLDAALLLRPKCDPYGCRRSISSCRRQWAQRCDDTEVLQQRCVRRHDFGRLEGDRTSVPHVRGADLLKTIAQRSHGCSLISAGCARVAAGMKLILGFARPKNTCNQQAAAFGKLRDYRVLNLGGKSAYPQASERNAPPERENGVPAPKPPPTPREKPPNILGF